MNKAAVLKNALAAVGYLQTQARNQLRTAKDLNDESLMQFWQQQISDHESTYQGLLALLIEAGRSS